jgi:amidase
MDSVGARLDAAGTNVDRSSGKLPDLAATNDAYVRALFTVMSRNQPGATSMSAHDYLGLLDVQLRARRAWAALFEDYDIVLAPSFGVTAFPHDDAPDQEKRRLTIDGTLEPFVTQMAWPGLASFADLPATAFPIGLTVAGLPIGIQAIGPYLEDRTTIGFAELVGREMGSFPAPPGF